ncbi:GntR family transcriptional regulator [Aurantimonas marianensis]|uniref:GntR family transcriptional regulator n=1 Tax=Aurantimonas marianensis TaxID=2920428 RepID=A0A9X2KGN9_9HYPH|nr:GntR family transcriptional regulator [Aurantimonas marianensis]MCP3056681.1 GntR family transcriptional regulator [Aurantimonas marianensis]
MTDGEKAPAFRPLYQQVRETLVRRLIDGVWTPGLMLPSEFQIAADLGVSQGTVRKALDAMAAEHLLIRRQGRGTFVALPEEGRILFQFFRLAADDDTRLFPDSQVLTRARGRADGAAAKALQLDRNDAVWRIDRVRHLGGRAVIAEQITLPVTKFSSLGEIRDLPNNVYALYSEVFSITIGRALERLKATAADATTATRLNCQPGHPVLSIERVAFALDGSPIEWRLSRCLTDGFHYQSDLR